MRKYAVGLLEVLKPGFYACLMAIAVRATAADARIIPSESMVPTLAVGDRLLVEKVSRYFRPPQYLDLIVFRPPHRAGVQGCDDLMAKLGFSGTAFIKRVIGLPGDRLAIRQGKVYRNGHPLKEPYIYEPPKYQMPDATDPLAYFHSGREVVVPARQVFVMGDNRNNSADSHLWGCLPMDRILGRAVVRYWPPERVSWWLSGKE